MVALSAINNRKYTLDMIERATQLINSGRREDLLRDKELKIFDHFELRIGGFCLNGKWLIPEEEVFDTVKRKFVEIFVLSW